MKGKFDLNIVSRKAVYHLEIERKITVIKGNSGTGKSSLLRLIADYLELGKDSGIKLSQDKPVRMLVLRNSSDWVEILNDIHDAIVFIDEDVRCLYDDAFQRAIWKADCYAVIVSRSGMFQALPYAIASIYELRTSRHGKTTVTAMYELYQAGPAEQGADYVLTEDSHSGFEMAQVAFSCHVEPANGNSNVLRALQEVSGEHNEICVIVDGAAFGGFIEPVLQLAEMTGRAKILAPESFEYILLQSDSLSKYLTNELVATYDYCDCQEYISWEKYYEALLVRLAAEHLRISYQKSKLPELFKNPQYVAAYLDVIWNHLVKRTS